MFAIVNGLLYVLPVCPDIGFAGRHESYRTTIGFMVSHKRKTESAPSRSAKAPTRRAIIRAVTSSTAIETGQSVRQLERTLRSSNVKRRVTLAR